MTHPSSEAAGAPGARPGQGTFPGMPTPLYAASASRLLAWLDCPLRYRMIYLDRPRLPSRPQRAHTSIGIAVHAALRDWWDLPRDRRTPAAGAALLERGWIDVGFRDPAQSATWRDRTSAEVAAYLADVDSGRPPTGTERGVAFKTATLAFFGRVDRIDDRGGSLVVVDYKTGRRAPTEQDARTSLPLALYAAALWKMLRRRCVRVELHHVPTGMVAAHEHSDASLVRKVREAESVAVDLRHADAEHAAHARQGDLGAAGQRFVPLVSPLCQWCDYRAHCPQGQRAGAEKSSWAALEESANEPGIDEDRIEPLGPAEPVADPVLGPHASG